MDPNTFNVGQGVGLSIKTTIPDHIIRHDISNEELDNLCDPKKGVIKDVFWASIGAMLGTLPTAVGSLLEFFFAAKTSSPLKSTELTHIMIFAGSISVAIILGILYFMQENSSRVLVQSIRNRSRHRSTN